MSESWDDYASEWDNNEDAISYADNVFKTLTDLVALEGLTVLDFGCGTGLLTERLSPIVNRVVALDSSKKMVSVLNGKKLPNVSSVADCLSEATIEKYSQLNQTFDLIVASSVCSFLPDYERTLQLIATMLSENGVFVQWDWLAEEEGTGFGLTEGQVESVLKQSGLNNIQISQPFNMAGPTGSMTVLMAAGSKAGDGA